MQYGVVQYTLKPIYEAWRGYLMLENDMKILVGMIVYESTLSGNQCPSSK